MSTFTTTGFVEDHELWHRAVEIAGQALVTDLPSSFDDAADCIRIVGFELTREAARRAYAEAEVGPGDIDVCELHDCFSTNELITYEALGLADEATATTWSTVRRRPTAAMVPSSTRAAG